MSSAPRGLPGIVARCVQTRTAEIDVLAQLVRRLLKRLAEQRVERFAAQTQPEVVGLIHRKNARLKLVDGKPPRLARLVQRALGVVERVAAARQRALQALHIGSVRGVRGL